MSIVTVGCFSETVFCEFFKMFLKPDGSLRIILDLSLLNENVVYQHFQMDNVQQAVNLVTPNCFMASINWKYAYYSIPIAPRFRKYLAFQWEGVVYRYTCLPNVLASAPRYFTKVSKVLLSELRKMFLFWALPTLTYCLLLADSLQQARYNVFMTVNISQQAGFVIHPEKSILHQITEITYLGFILNSKTMLVRLTSAKAAKIQSKCRRLLHAQSVTT